MLSIQKFLISYSNSLIYNFSPTLYSIWKSPVKYAKYAAIVFPVALRRIVCRFLSFRKREISIFYILSYLLSKRLGCLSGYLVSPASIQKIFCESCTTFKLSFDEFFGEKLVSPFYSSTISGWLPNSPFIC